MHINVGMLSKATRVLQVHAKVGNAVKKQLPPGLNPKILEQLEASFGSPPGRAASPPVPAVAKRMSDSSTPKQAPAPAHRSTAPAVAQSSGEVGLADLMQSLRQRRLRPAPSYSSAAERGRLGG